jgi:hypothetical protein
MAIGIDCDCGYPIRSWDQFITLLSRCPECGKMYRLPARPELIQSASEATHEVCAACGEDFQIDGDFGVGKLSGGHYYHRACSDTTAPDPGDARRRAAIAQGLIKPADPTPEQLKEIEASLAPLEADPWRELTGEIPTSSAGVLLKSTHPPNREIPWAWIAIGLGAAAPIILLLVILLEMLWS